MRKFYIIIVLICFCFVLTSCKNTNDFTKAVWWWDDTLDTQTYLDFLYENNITEIFYCSDDFDNETSSFISKANKKNIKVYFLAGEYQWLTNSTPLYHKIEKYLEYQNNFSHSKFSGIHLDIEPHQHEDFSLSEVRKTLITNLVSLVYDLSTKYTNIHFDYDIPFWLDDTITFNQSTLPAYAHIISYANRVTIMSYRDSAQAIYDCAKDEIEFAKSVNKTLILGVETHSNEGDKVSFMEEGKTFMMQELDKLEKMLPSNFGISIHNAKTWKNLKD